MSDDLELLVVGGGPAGFSAAKAYREAGGAGAVAIVADEERMPYRRPPLTKELLRGEVDESELALVQEGWLADHEVSLICGRAVALHPGSRELIIAGGRRLGYARCVIATGSVPTRLTAPGCDDPAVRVVRSLDHVRELNRRLRDGGNVVVVGSGFIGCEIASSLCSRGQRVTLISDEAAPNERRLGPAAANELARWLEEDGVTLALGAGLEAIERSASGLRVSAGEIWWAAEVVVMATGVVPRSELLADCDVALQDGAVPVDAGMRSALANVLAAGDICRAHNVTAGRSLRVEHWGDALGQGEIAGRSAAGLAACWDAVPGFWSTIGRRTLKYVAWGDGHDAVRFERRPDGGFVAWYGRDGALVGVLAHKADDSYERGRQMIASGASWS